MKADEGKKKKHRPPRIYLLSLGVLILFVFVIGSYAWYSYTNKKLAPTEDTKVLKPYTLFLYGNNAVDALELSIGYIHPQEVKQIVFCVSNDPNKVPYKPSETFQYELEVVHTNNLPFLYTIQEVEKAQELDEGAFSVDEGVYFKRTGQVLKYDNVSKQRNDVVFQGGNYEEVVNQGTYQNYKNTSLNQPFTLSSVDGKYEYDYYLLEIQWDTIQDIKEYEKEVDMVYLVSNIVRS